MVPHALLAHWPLTRFRNVILDSDSTRILGDGDTLTLLRGPDEYWYELGHSDN